MTFERRAIDLGALSAILDRASTLARNDPPLLARSGPLGHVSRQRASGAS